MKTFKTVLLLCMATLLIPTLVFLLVGLLESMSLSDVLAALHAQITASRLNLLVVSVLGVLPFALLAVILWVRSRFSVQASSQAQLSVWGGVPILGSALFVNYEGWSTFLPSRSFPGFPHGLEFVIGPFFFAPIGMVLGLVAGWLVLRIRATTD